MTRRRGKTLVEMLVLISVLTIILGLVATSLIVLFKTDRQVRRDLEQVTALARLSSKFRADAHAADSCQVAEACDLALPDGRVVRYAAGPERITREVRRGDAVEHRDAFLLPATATAKFELPDETQGRLVRLTIAAAENSDRPYLTAVRPATIEAAVGLSQKETP
jgi:type II secretory pathway pseudopilin PulG